MFQGVKPLVHATAIVGKPTLQPAGLIPKFLKHALRPRRGLAGLLLLDPPHLAREAIRKLFKSPLQSSDGGQHPGRIRLPHDVARLSNGFSGTAKGLRSLPSPNRQLADLPSRLGVFFFNRAHPLQAFDQVGQAIIRTSEALVDILQ